MILRDASVSCSIEAGLVSWGSAHGSWTTFFMLTEGHLPCNPSASCSCILGLLPLAEQQNSLCMWLRFALGAIMHPVWG